MNQFLLGALVAASSVAGLFFLRFWRDTRDRLFLMFALAFWALAVNWTGIAVTDSVESRTPFYVVRLLAFLLIVVAIADKNRATATRPAGTTGPRLPPSPTRTSGARPGPQPPHGMVPSTPE